MDVEAIVNSANNDFILGSGVSGAINRLGGPEIQEECHRIGTMPLGSVAVTTGGKLKCRFIFHAAINPLGLWADAKSIRNAFKGCLREIAQRSIKTVAVPAIGTGSGAFSIDRCADILLEEIREFAKANPPLEMMSLVLFDEKSFKAFEERFIRKFPDVWTELTGMPLPDLPPEPEPEPEPPPLPPRPPPRPRHQGPPGRGPQPIRGGPPQQGNRPPRRDRGPRRGPPRRDDRRGPPPPPRPNQPPPPPPPPNA